MNKIIFCTSLFSVFALGSSTFANDPTKGYCQTVDPTVCGWGNQNAAPARPLWMIAVAFDEDTGKYNMYQSTDRHDAARRAARECKSYNIVNGSPKSCRSVIYSENGAHDPDTPAVLAKGITPAGKYGFNLRYNKYGTRGFWPQNTRNVTLSPQEAAMDDCQNRYKMRECKIVYGAN